MLLGKRYSTRFDFITQATTGPNPAGYLLESEYDSRKNCTNSQMFHPSSLIEEMRIPVFVSIFEMKKREKTLPRNVILLFVPFSQKIEEWIDLFFYWIIGFGSVGTDGARTRSFRLDRAVLWPIELQSPGNKEYSIHILMISVKPFLFRFSIGISAL